MLISANSIETNWDATTVVPLIDALPVLENK
jgi:hypothetical protein